jgi:hypothetical protein
MKDKNAIFKYIFISILLFILLGIILYYIIKKFNFEHFISKSNFEHFISKSNFEHFISKSNFEHFISKSNFEHFISKEDIGDYNENEFPKEEEKSPKEKEKLLNCQNIVGSSSEFNNIGLNFKFGISSITKTGSIRFKTPFKNTPLIQTQIIVDSSSSDNVYSVNIMNINKNGFDYVKQKAVATKKNNGEFTIIQIEPSCNEKFSWTAIGN